ncbi:Pimeloyl-ACP methyl ester carboxylesterase [Flavobacterium resistens]|uniref:Alpha/beta fold hydrolase n=1 Tax=Flavobacterium resistens TaxID=443612 RepID=A0A521F853_9FLAO|nr:alpha/beta hydrolase [Flavobacterium resistens]MRX70103.1 alpha/beta fold hydrolase [Flavobacterium resistens]SMO92395.1 Pimeloyl-ACP methyl ester carboxylesterase [Flavobacterium resistens]
MKNNKKTFVLVHAAWHGAWSFDKTKKKLEESDVKVITFDLPGHGKDKTEIKDISLAAYVQKVKDEILKLNEPVVLVGHSLAGFVVSQVAEEIPDRIEKLVFISAMIPYEGKTAFDIISADTKSQLLQNLIFSEDKSWATVNEETLKNVVYNRASAEQIIEATPNLVRQATQPFFAVVATTANTFGKIDKTYIICENDKIISSTAQRNLIEQIGIRKSLILDTGHVPNIENPDALALAILDS